MIFQSAPNKKRKTKVKVLILVSPNPRRIENDQWLSSSKYIGKKVFFFGLYQKKVHHP